MRDWAAFVAHHGVVLATARGPVPSIAETLVGAPIKGSWWAHPKGHAIFEALSSLDDHADILCFKLVDKKVTFVHHRRWPALVELAAAGELAADRVAAIRQEHTPSGAHKNIITPYPDWVPAEVAAAARALSLDDARAVLGPAITPGTGAPRGTRPRTARSRSPAAGGTRARSAKPARGSRTRR
jgi:hypothetical protein